MASLSEPNLDPESHKSRFRDETALTCVRSALSLVTILPEDPGTGLSPLPWWGALHYVMQASIILLLYLSGKSSRGILEMEEGFDLNMSSVLAAVKKSVLWLYGLAKTGLAARRAFRFCESFVRSAPRSEAGCEY